MVDHQSEAYSSFSASELRPGRWEAESLLWIVSWAFTCYRSSRSAPQIPTEAANGHCMCRMVIRSQQMLSIYLSGRCRARPNQSWVMSSLEGRACGACSRLTLPALLRMPCMKSSLPPSTERDARREAFYLGKGKEVMGYEAQHSLIDGPGALWVLRP